MAVVLVARACGYDAKALPGEEGVGHGSFHNSYDGFECILAEDMNEGVVRDWCEDEEVRGQWREYWKAIEGLSSIY